MFVQKDLYLMKPTSLRGYCLYFRALQNYLLSSLLQNSTQDLNHQHHFSIATVLLELGHLSISGIPLSPNLLNYQLLLKAD